MSDKSVQEMASDCVEGIISQLKTEDSVKGEAEATVKAFDFLLEVVTMYAARTATKAMPPGPEQMASSKRILADFAKKLTT